MFQPGSRFSKTVDCHGPFLTVMGAALPLQIAAALLYFVLFGIQGIKEWEIRTKPVPMLVLIAVMGMFFSFYGRNRLHLWVFVGVIFSLAGDVVLMSEGHEEFMLGVGLFAMAHIAYMVGFTIKPEESSEAPSVEWHGMRGLPFFVLASIAAFVLTSKITDDSIMVAAVWVYALVLAGMAWRAVARVGYPAETRSSQLWAACGAMLFMVSDLMLAFNKFYAPLPYVQVWVLSTYWIAQTMIVFSLQRAPWDQRFTKESGIRA